MNAQLISFQQFVKDNQGKLITFLHNDKIVSKVVADIIQGEYFTGKSQVSDTNIDSFYYFSDCKIIDEKHPLISVLEKHNVSVLNLSIGRSCIFKYNNYDDYDTMINGTCLTTSQPVGFHIDSIKEAWSVAEGRYTKVYSSQEQNTVISSGKAFTRHPNGKVKTEAYYKDGKLHGDYYEYFVNGRRSKFIQYNNGLKYGIYIEYDITNKIVTHKTFKNDIEIVDLPKEVKILYRGNPKTVEIINEYSHDNGKEYVIIKDITDNGKTKSLFKEFIKWL